MATVQKQPSLLDDFTTFLAKRPTNAQIIAWRPTARVRERISDLLYRNNAGTLDGGEQQEVESIVQAETMLRLFKAKLQLAAAKKRA